MNVWTDGLGHVACAWYALGDERKGDFYLGEMRKLLIPLAFGERKTLGLPYAAARTSGYEWVDPDAGFTACAAWLIFAKHHFDPLRLSP